MPAESFLRLLQFSDGLFPAGGYAHSFGLETLVQSGRVQNAADVSAFLETYLESSAAPADAAAVLCAAKYSRGGDLVALIHLDQFLDALKPAAETRDASRQMGRQTLRVLRELFSSATHSPLVTSHPLPLSSRSERPSASQEISLHVPKSRSGNESGQFSQESLLGARSFSSDIQAEQPTGALAPEELASSLLTNYSTSVESEKTPCHHPIVFGIASAVHGWEPRETASAFLYATSAMIAGASLRLIPLGQLTGQRILAQAGTLIATLAETVLDKTEDDMWSFAPEIEIAALRHESLDGRLFRS
jgi:urease accessory protein UreF